MSSFESENLENLNSKNNINNIITIPEKCLRCNLNSPSIICEDCYPLIYFCANCDENIHEMKIKKNHKRVLIDNLKLNVNKLNFDIHHENFVNNEFLNSIKNILDKEKKNLLNKSYNTEKELEKTKSFLEEKYMCIQNKLNDLIGNKDFDMTKIKENLENKFKMVNEEKESKIEELLENNNVLNEENYQLEQKLNFYLKELNDLSNKRNMEENYYQNKIDNLKQEKENLLKYYEKKLQFLNDNINDDKNSFINSCEEKMNNIKNYYKNEKEKNLKEIKLNEENLKILSEKHRKEQKEIVKKIEELKKKTNSKSKETEKLFNQFQENENIIAELKLKIKKNNLLYNQEKEKAKWLKKDNKRLLKIQFILLKRLEILNKISRGKIIRKEEEQFLLHSNDLDYLFK